MGHKLLLAFFLEAFLFFGSLNTNIINSAPGIRLTYQPVAWLEVNTRLSRCEIMLPCGWSFLLDREPKYLVMYLKDFRSILCSEMQYPI